MKGCFKRFFNKIIPIFLCLLILLMPFSAYAVDTDLVESEVSWIDRGDIVSYNGNYFQGFSKYIADQDAGVFYFFTRFTDYRINPESQENITLGFTVENEAHRFSFRVDRNGIIGGTNENVEVYSNFSEASCLRQGGGIFVAFELKNKTDRTLNNSISCEYYCGENLTYNLLEGVSLNLYVQEAQDFTSKPDSNTVTKASAAAADSQSTASKATAQSSTKFSAAGKPENPDANTVQNHSSKFSGSGTAAGTDIGLTDAVELYEEYYENNAAVNADENDAGMAMDQTLSAQAKLLIVVFTLLFVAGIICVILGLVKKKDTEEQPEHDKISDEESCVQTGG